MFFFKQKTAYEVRISDWSSDVCSSDLEKGVKAIGMSADLLDLESYQKIQDQAVAELAAPDIAIYNLDPPPPGTFADVTEEMLAQAYHSVVLCYAWMLRVVLPHMQAQRWGREIGRASCRARVCPYV